MKYYVNSVRLYIDISAAKILDNNKHFVYYTSMYDIIS